jgi:hypothetical protein
MPKVKLLHRPTLSLDLAKYLKLNYTAQTPPCSSERYINQFISKTKHIYKPINTASKNELESFKQTKTHNHSKDRQGISKET